MVSVQTTQNTQHQVPILKGLDEVFTKVAGLEMKMFGH
jgi:hypothetical protein